MQLSHFFQFFFFRTADRTRFLSVQRPRHGSLSFPLHVDVDDVAEVGESSLQDVLRHSHAIHVHRVAFTRRLAVTSVISLTAIVSVATLVTIKLCVSMDKVGTSYSEKK